MIPNWLPLFLCLVHECAWRDEAIAWRGQFIDEQWEDIVTLRFSLAFWEQMAR